MNLNWNRILNILIVALILVFIAKKIYLYPKQKSGEKAPDFTETKVDGQSLTLSSLQGNYVLLDFWGSWCGPCRKENKELTKLYSDFKDSSFKNASAFKIVSIALEKNKNGAIKAIQNDGLIWPDHLIFENTFDSPVAMLYKVREIPQKYLINPDGMIVLVNPSIADVHDYLSNQVKKDGIY
ncbi:MAG: TlpA family protein disulfide reductase [Saprospiraceae bacterium]|nr:TlpA family protein disulfide reductase [Saprospiraceae bacterium]